MEKPEKSKELIEIAKKLQISRVALMRIAIFNLVKQYQASGKIEISS